MTSPAKDGVALSVLDVVKSYGPIRALDGVSISVKRGEFVALLGPNGAGKSTLFQLLTGLFVPDSGLIEVDGYDIRKTAVPALGSLGVVFQSPTLDPELSLRANLRFHTDMHGIPASIAKVRIEEELKVFGLSERAKDPVRTLSGGNRRRVELARALLHDPSILLMDEATVGLDPRSRHEMVDMVFDLRDQRGIAVLWATHLVEEVERADRVIVLHRGKVLKEGTPAQIIDGTGTQNLSDAFLKLTRETGGHRAAA